jgi:hypothetical protein
MSFEIAPGINSFTVLLAAAVSISIIIINSVIIVYQVWKIAK